MEEGRIGEGKGKGKKRGGKGPPQEPVAPLGPQLWHPGTATGLCKRQQRRHHVDNNTSCYCCIYLVCVCVFMFMGLVT